MRGPTLILAMGGVLVTLILLALWWTAEPVATGAGEITPSAEPPPPERSISGRAPPPAAPSRSPPLPPAVEPSASPAADAGPPLVPGRNTPLPVEQWPERLRPVNREVTTPPVEDTPAVRREEIRTAIESVKPLVARCFTDAAAKNPGDQKVVLRFTIEGQGTSGFFKDGEVSESTIVDPWVQACFLEALTDARFPAPSGGGTVTVTYPFSFVVAKDGGT